ncbi:MAG: S9 family peptidase [Anaerolineae bacterium]|nr:S9 family peptidase [Anaerolineae bacterium]
MQIEALLSARLFMAPQTIGERLYFISNLSGRLSLYAMDHGGSVPEPLLPPQIAMQNPHLLEGTESFYVFPKLGKILVMLDQDGDENYHPLLIPIKGGFPENAFGDAFADYRIHCLLCDPEANLTYLVAESCREQTMETYQSNLETGDLTKIGKSAYGLFPVGHSQDHTQVALVEQYTVGDGTLYLWPKRDKKLKVLYGKPLESRTPGTEVPLSGINRCHFVNEDSGLLVLCTLFEDTGGLGYLDLAKPHEIVPVTISGSVHTGIGEMTDIKHLEGNRFLLIYNIDGCSWLYEGTFRAGELSMQLDRVICGQNELANGALEHHDYDREGNCHALSFSTAISPTQLYTVNEKKGTVIQHTRERILGIPPEHLSPGEDASYTSFDGLRVSARLYLPAEPFGFEGPHPLVYYVHGGPQGQERPDFAWFSMPLIQLLTLRGFAVFVPNARGSTGYGLNYTKLVDRDWGGDDRLDHVHAMTKVLPKDERVDMTRAGVVGRSYGGYMTLMLAARHPELWAAAVDMFGPYDLVTFGERIPETWKPYFRIALGDPSTPDGLKFLKERSPATYIDGIACPMLVIQGRNDPRVIEAESRDVVEDLKEKGKNVEILIFPDEGHDVLKFENRVTCYNAIAGFFEQHLKGRDEA